MNYKKMLNYKVFNFLKRLLYNSFMAGCIAIIAAFIVVHFSNCAISVVLSESMFPQITTGDVLLIKKQQTYQVGDVVQFDDEMTGLNITHRIIDIKEISGEKYFICHGDNEISVKYFYLNSKKDYLDWKEDSIFLQNLTLEEIQKHLNDYVQIVRIPQMRGKVVEKLKLFSAVYSKFV